jgi:hypothetical protein
MIDPYFSNPRLDSSCPDCGRSEIHSICAGSRMSSRELLMERAYDEGWDGPDPDDDEDY